MPSWPRFSSCGPRACSASGEKRNHPAARGGPRAAARPPPGDRNGDLDLRDLRSGAEPAARLHRAPFLRPGDLLRLGGLRGGLAPQALRHRRLPRARHRRLRGRGLGGARRLSLRTALGALLHHADLRAEPALLLRRLPVDERHRRRGRYARNPAAGLPRHRLQGAAPLLRFRVGAVPRLALDHEAHRRVAPGQDPAGDPRERGPRRGRGLRRGALQARRLRHRRRLLRRGRRALRDALRHRAAGGDRLRHLGQRCFCNADRRLGFALRAGHRLVRLHLALGVGEHAVGALAAAPRRGVRDRGALLARRRRRSLVPVLVMAVLETKNLSKAFGALTAVNDVSLGIEAGTLHSIIGPNGAGKTTLFNLLTGTTAPSSGRILFDGRDITGTPAHRVAHLGLARSFQRTNVFPVFSLLDNVWVAAFACAPSWKGILWRRADRYPEVRARALAALADVGLADKAGRPVREISHGEQRQLELAIALAAAPRVLLLDEPAAGLSPEETKRLVALVRALKGRYTIVLIEHKMDIIMSVSDRISVMHFGRLIAEGTPAEIQRNREVRRAYLGGVAA